MRWRCGQNARQICRRGRRCRARQPLRRLGEPDDVAGTAVLLAARAGNFITGQTLVVDGGGLIGGGEPLR